MIRLSSLAALGLVLCLALPAQAGRIVWPCSGQVTSAYGPRTCSACASDFHYGIDIGVGVGTILGSTGNGTVTSYTYSSCGGNTYKIGYGSGWETRFLHCSASIAPVGATVTRNVDTAKSGNTGSCTSGPHLHFEVRKDGVAQSIPGSAGTYVTRGYEIPADYAGLNDFRNPSYFFDSSNDGFTQGNSSGPIAWTNSGWPGVAYADQTGNDMFWYSPPTSYTGGGDPSINIQLFPQNGSSANHTLQLFWKTAAENFWDSLKSTPRVSYAAQNQWTSINLSMNNAKYWNQAINQLRLDFDDTNVGARFIVNHVYLQTTSRQWFNGSTDGWSSINSLTPTWWTNCCGWPGVLVTDQNGADAHMFGPTFNMLGANNDVVRVRVYPQNGTTANHDMQVFWETAAEPNFSESKSVRLNFTAQNQWIELTFRVGQNGSWPANWIRRLRLDFDHATNTQTRWLVDHIIIDHATN